MTEQLDQMLGNIGSRLNQAEKLVQTSWGGHVRHPRTGEVITAGQCGPCRRFVDRFVARISMFVPPSTRGKRGPSMGWYGWWLPQMGRKTEYLK